MTIYDHIITLRFPFWGAPRRGGCHRDRNCTLVLSASFRRSQVVLEKHDGTDLDGGGDEIPLKGVEDHAPHHLCGEMGLDSKQHVQHHTSNLRLIDCTKLCWFLEESKVQLNLVDTACSLAS